MTEAKDDRRAKTDKKVASDPKDSLLRRICIELSFLAEGERDLPHEVVARLRSVLRKDAYYSDLEMAATPFFDALVNRRHLKRPHMHESSELELVQALVENIPAHQNSEFTQLKIAADEARSLQEAMAVVRRAGWLLAKLASSTDTVPTLADGSLDNFVRSRGAARRVTDRALSQPAQSILRALKPMLERALAELVKLEESTVQAQALQGRLQAVGSVEDLQITLEQTLELFADQAARINEERRETENFLTQLCAEVRTIGSSMTHLTDNEELSQGVQRFQKELEVHLLDIEAAARTQAKTTDLNRMIGGSVKRIVEDCVLLAEQQEAYVEHVRNLAEEVKSKTSKMEKEIEDLRVQVGQRQHLMMIDPLTQVANRYGYELRVEDEYARCRRLGYPLSLVVVDVDQFKAINDRYGHRAGDRILKEVANIMKLRLRVTDHVSRFGGDEFVLLLPDTSYVGAVKLMMDLKDIVAARKFRHDGMPVVVQISCGAAEMTVDDTPETTFERADREMFRDKRAAPTRAQ